MFVMWVSSLSEARKPDMVCAYIGIGSNMDRYKNIRSGLQALQLLGTNMSVSAIYESKSYGFEGDNFYNLAVMLETTLEAHDLNNSLREIEKRHGRVRNVPRFSSRTLDLDLLLYGNLIRHDALLDVPRRDIMTCAFVLGPLAEIAGQLTHPETGQGINEIWSAFDRAGQQIWPVEFNTGL